MRNINILINEDHSVSFDNDYIGLNRENLQGNIVFTFKNFVNGQARAEVIIGDEDGYILLNKVGETYTMPIKSSLLTSDFVIMQLVIDEPGDDEYPIWKSEAFTLKVGYSINAETTIPEDYPSWVQILDGLINDTEQALENIDNALEQVNTAIEETNNLNIDVSKEDTTTTVELTKKDGTTKEVEIEDGEDLEFKWEGTSLGVKTSSQSTYQYVDLQGVQGETGPMGSPFTIAKTYPTEQAMIADYDNMQVGDYVMIDGDIELQENATLWVKEETPAPTTKWHYLADFSGASGIQGETGATPNIQIGTVTSGATPSVTRTGTNENPILNFVLQKGDKGVKGDTGATGATGNGIASIVKTSTSGLVDTYTITYTNGTTTTYEVTNGEDGEVTQAQLDEVQAELDRYKMLENALPKVTGTGESITLDNTANAGMKMELSPSDTTQETTTGKNKFNINNTTLTSGAMSVDISGNKLTLTATGTSGAQYCSNIMSGLDSTKTYTYSFKAKKVVKGTDGQSYISIVCAGSNDGVTFTGINNRANLDPTQGTEYEYNNQVTGYTYYRLNIYNNASTPVTIGEKTEYYDIQFEEGSSASTWEPYTGGQASPNPQYPQLIHVVSGDNEIKVINKNLINNQNLDYDYSNVSKTYNTLTSLETGIRFKTTSTGKPIVMFYTGIDLTQYVGKVVKMKSTFTNGGEIRIGVVNKEGTSRQTKVYTTTSNSEISYTIPNDLDEKKYLVYTLAVDTTINTSVDFTNLILTLDSDITYVPYEEQTQPITLGVENLFDKSTYTSGKYLNASNVLVTSSDWGCSDYIEVSSNTIYSMSGLLNGTGYSPACCQYDSSKNFISASTSENATSYSITTSSTTKYIRFSFKEVDLNTAQVEIGSKANSYSEYGVKPIEMCKIGAYEDEFYLPSGKNKFPIPTMIDNAVRNTLTKNGVTCTINNNGTFTLSGTANAQVDFNFFSASSEPLILDSDSCSIGAYGLVSGVKAIISGNTNNGVTYTEITNTSNTKENLTITDKTKPFSYFILRVSNGTALGTNGINVQVQLNGGSILYEYEPYNIMWYKKDNIGNVVLDGTQTDKYFFSNSYQAIGYTDSSIANVGGSPIMCDKAVRVLTSQLVDTNGIAQNNVSNRILIKFDGCSSYNTGELIAQYFTNNTYEVRYALATPTYTLLNDTLQAQLNNIKDKLLSYQNQTNISQVNNDRPFVIGASALKDLSNL